MTPSLIVAKRIGVERPATKEEVCQHWMVARPSSCGGRRHTKCAYCGKSGSRPMKPGESILG